MGIEKNPNSNIIWHQMGAFPLDRVHIYIQAAEELGISYELISNDDERVKDPIKFMHAYESEQIIDVRYGDRFKEFSDRVNELSPSPPPYRPKIASPDSVTRVKLEGTGVDAVAESRLILGPVLENVT